MSPQEKWADKIAKLLRKAEDCAKNPGGVAEAEVFLAKAQQLMVKYAIDEELLAKARGENNRSKDEIIEGEIAYTGIFREALYNIGAAIGRANNCRILHSKREWEKPHQTICHVIGFESDVRNVRLLDASVQIQAGSALAAWWKDQDSSWMSNMEKYKARREFLFGFANGLSLQLEAATRAGRKAAAEEEAKREQITTEAASESVALIVRSREDQVKDWMDQKYGRSLRSVNRRYSSGGYSASAAGREAGQRADVGRPKVQGRKGLPR